MTAESSYLPGASERANEQVRVYEATDGAERWDMRGVPVVILSTRGRHSGAIRKMPLMRVTDGEKYAVIASMGGAPKHPVWYLNLQADPGGRAAGQGCQAAVSRAHSDRGRAPGVVGAGRRGVAGLRDLPDEDRPADPGGDPRTTA